MSKFTLFLCITATILLSGCSPAGKLKRAQKLIDKAEQAGAKWKVDTVYISKEVIVPERVLDTLVRYVNRTDTITVTENNVITKIKYNTKEKNVFVHTVCPKDTVRIEVPVQVTKEIKAGASVWDIIKICLLVAVVAALLSRLLWK